MRYIEARDIEGLYQQVREIDVFTTDQYRSDRQLICRYLLIGE